MTDGGFQGLFLEDLELGRSAQAVRRVSEQHLAAFAEVSGDANPIHMDEAYARTTLMKGRVVHGMLLGGFISALLGTELPGPGAIYLSQTLTFKRPVRLGDEVTVRAAVKAIDGEDVTLSTACLVRRKACVEGEAVVRVARRPISPKPVSPTPVSPTPVPSESAQGA